MKQLPPQSLLQERFNYDPDTGIVTWRVSPARSVKVGQIVGSKNRLGYITVYINDKSYLLHRVIYKLMTGTDPHHIDHINHNPSDNRWCNLRSVTHQENMMNRKDCYVNCPDKTLKSKVSEWSRNAYYRKDKYSHTLRRRKKGAKMRYDYTYIITHKNGFVDVVTSKTLQQYCNDNHYINNCINAVSVGRVRTHKDIVSVISNKRCDKQG